MALVQSMEGLVIAALIAAHQIFVGFVRTADGTLRGERLIGEDDGGSARAARAEWNRKTPCINECSHGYSPRPSSSLKWFIAG
jgi:hypothetical protein